MIGVAVLTLAVFACADSATAGTAGPGETVTAFAAYLDVRVPELMRKHGVPGASVAIVHDGSPVWAAGYGLADADSARPMTVDTTCRAESISKSVTAWGVMKLVEDGFISLDAPIQQYLGDWKLPGSEYDATTVTVRQLLSGTSGLPLGTIGPTTEYAPGSGTPSLREFIDGDARLVAEPGSEFIYSDVGFNLLELIVENVTGEPYSSFMQREILDPLDMHDSSFAWRRPYHESLAIGYEMDGTPVAPYVYPASASGGLFTDVEDIARFVAAGMLAPGNEPRALASDTLAAIYEPRVEIPGLFGLVADEYAYGHFLETLPDSSQAVWHGGQGHGWMTHFHSIPESGEAIVILTNSQRSWPLIAAVLTDWARWSGAGSVRFGRIIPATTAVWVVIALIAIVSFVQTLRVGFGIARGSRRWMPTFTAQRLRRLGQIGAGATLIALVAWRISLPYVFESSIFPSAAPWAAAVLAVFGLVMIALALAPARPASD